MLSKMAWNAFKKTGDINTFLEYTQTKNIEENFEEEKKNLNEAKNGDNKNKGYYFKRK